MYVCVCLSVPVSVCVCVRVCVPTCARVHVCIVICIGPETHDCYSLANIHTRPYPLLFLTLFIIFCLVFVFTYNTLLFKLS